MAGQVEALGMPERPATVPADARFVEAPVPHWRRGASEATSDQPTGLQTYWTAHGEPIRYELYDTRGRLLARHVSHQPDPITDLATRFRDDPDRFDWYPTVGRYHDALHEALVAVARAGTAEHRLAYAQALTFLDQRLGRAHTLTFPRHDRILELFHACPPHDGELVTPDGFAFTAYALDAALAVGDEPTLRTWGPSWLATPLAPRPRDRIAGDLGDRIVRALAGEVDDDPVSRARRCTGRWLIPVLGRPGHTAVLCVDEVERAYWLEDDRVELVPLELDATGPSLVPAFAALGALTARAFSAAESRGVWQLQRYGSDLYVFGATRTANTFQIEPTVDLFVRCPDDAWAATIAELFEATRPFVATHREPFDDGDGAWLREYRADRDHLHAHGRRWLGVVGRRLVSGRSLAAGSTPPPTGPRPRRLGCLQHAASRAEAIAAFDAAERALVRQGHFLTSIQRLMTSDLDCLLHGKGEP